MKPLAPLVCLLVVLAGCGGPTGTTTPAESTGSIDGSTSTPTNPETTSPPETTGVTATPTERSTGGASWRVTITDVVDGDTMDVRFANGTTDTVRLLGVDTPEVDGENTPDEFEGIPETEAGADWLHGWGENASAFADDELDGRQVVIGLDPAADTRGSYGRLLVYVRVDGRLFNRQLLAQGYARFYDAPLTRADAFERLEARAQRNGTGLWGYEAA